MKRTKETNGPTTAKPKKPRKAAAAGHKLAPLMPEGSILTDITKVRWRLGKPIGSGGFGLIYLTQQDSSSSVKDDAEFVMKLEPVENGPLFCELHFYQRAAKQDMIKEWMSKHSLKSLGVPKFITTGQHEHGGSKLRFMVMQRFGTDLQKLFEKNGRQLPMHTVFLLGLKLIDILEYLHGKGYAHADIKAANLMTDFKDPHQIYLIDYGLAFRFMPDGQHKEYKEDPRKAHDGTIEFTSRDAHKGATPSRRGDLEILGYCMLQWICQKLPWENNLQNKDYVRDQKIQYMSDIPALFNACLPGKKFPSEFGTFLTYVTKLKYDEEPSYSHCRNLFSQTLKKLGHKETDKLEFSNKTINMESSPKRAEVLQPSRGKLSRKRTANTSLEEGFSESPLKHKFRTGSPSVDEEAARPVAKVRRKSSNSPKVSTARKPRPAGPRKPTAAVLPQSSVSSPLLIAAQKARSPAGRGGSRVAASRAKSSVATQTSPGLRGLPRSRRGR